MLELLITGTHSFIGGAVQRHLANSEQIHASCVSLRGDAWKDLDLTRYDCILHAAGVAHVDPNPSLAETYDAVNHRLTAQVARKARAAGVGQFIFLSSIIVFGDASPAGMHTWIGADTPPNPSNAYGKSKLDAENALRALESPDFHVAILRPPMVYGAGCKGNYNTLVRLARKMPVFPAFDNHRSMIYVENLAELIARIALSGSRGTFHPRDGQPRSVSEIVQEICVCHAKRMRFTRALAPAVRLAGRKGLVRRAFGDMAYDASAPDFPENYRLYDFSEAIRRTEGDAQW